MNIQPDEKEIRLFGEKSIREEAYRQKIIQLEKEIMKLQTILKESEKKPENPHNENPQGKSPILPEYSEGIFYEQVIYLDEKVKGYLHMFEKKAQEINERLRLQAQGLIEPIYKKQHSIFRSPYVYMPAALFLASLLFLATTNFSAIKDRMHNKEILTELPSERANRIREILQKNGYYANQYTIISLTNYNKMYKAIVELHFEPTNRWSLKTIAQEIIHNFKSIAPEKAIRLDLMFDSKTFVRVDYSPISDQSHYDFYIKS